MEKWSAFIMLTLRAGHQDPLEDLDHLRGVAPLARQDVESTLTKLQSIRPVGGDDADLLAPPGVVPAVGRLAKVLTRLSPFQA
ncbi:hypothetical protein [Streptomyces sp. NPDC006267]|uniref:hypothetical protein n=1 Tax=Streptomyces sp. NPDC006267 TaxID=3157173 RepID=UPI0033B3CB35